MTQYDRNELRIDNTTQAALEEISRLTCQTKAALVRKYIQEGVARDAPQLQKEVETLRNFMKASADQPSVRGYQMAENTLLDL
jgi:hypothetical protein